MSQPIPFKARSRDFREELRVRLEQAPADHAEAILAGYEVLQGLHDRGVLELLRGVLGGGDRILEIAVEAAKTPAAIRGIRNLIIMLKLAGSIDPDQLHAAMDVGHKQAPSLWEIGKRARTDDARRGIETAVALFGIFGAALNEEQRAKNN
ncbi:MAG TPA: hypothetical protein VK578_22320 [Edaphobacter sp.]|jgi:uncharacterized protein YjgD (DUF1641 family)|nr:hypothetical protein [Edaphobacter sp.]